MSDLLKESIADAKAVRETALANAKNFLEESFANSMKEMFADRLKEEMGVDGKEEPAPDAAPPSDTNPDAAPKPGNPVGSDNPTPEEADSVSSSELDEILRELGEGSAAPTTSTGLTSKEPQTAAAAIKADTQTNPDVSTEEMAENIDEEISLDELLAELDADDGTSTDTSIDIDKTVAPTAPAAGQCQCVPQTTPVVPAATQTSDQLPPTDDASVSQDDMAEALIQINEENERLTTELSNHIKTIKYLKGVLSETNLLNAKLLYTNKLFKGRNLTEDQKMKVINTFDLTRNIREVKLTYTVLAESFNAGASVVKKKLNTNTTVQNITEGLASKSIASTKPESTIVDPQATEMSNRLQALAGIKKKVLV